MQHKIDGKKSRKFNQKLEEWLSFTGCNANISQEIKQSVKTKVLKKKKKKNKLKINKQFNL